MIAALVIGILPPPRGMVADFFSEDYGTFCAQQLPSAAFKISIQVPAVPNTFFACRPDPFARVMNKSILINNPHDSIYLVMLLLFILGGWK